MTVEQGLADILRFEPDRPTVWDAYRDCRVCSAPGGTPCFAMWSRVVDGRREGPAVELPRPHGYRQRRSGR